MKILTVLLLIAIWLCIPGCGGEETLAPTIVRDTTPPTIIATNVQGGPIPVNTPIVLVFSERVNLTSAQRGISLRSSIDAEIVKGVVTLENQGREAKFTPIERMTTGGYVLTALGIEDMAGNVLLTPISIFFGAVEVDTTQRAADVIPPRVVSTIPSEGQSVEATDSLVIRFDEEVDAASAEAGIVVSGVVGMVEVVGAVTIFKPIAPMIAGKHTLTIIGVKDLAGNVMESSLIIGFEVIAPPPEVIPPPTTIRPAKGKTLYRVSQFGGGHQIWFEAEDFDERNPDNDEFFPIVDKDGAFGKAITRAGGAGGMIRWTFDISKAGGRGGTWYFWGRVINPSNNSDYMLVLGDPDDKKIPNGPPFPGENEVPPFVNGDDRIFEQNIGGPGAWAWGRDDHGEGHTKELQDGENTMFIFHRQGNDSKIMDVFMWTDNPNYRPTDDDYEKAKEVRDGRPVERIGKLASLWGWMRLTR